MNKTSPGPWVVRKNRDSYTIRSGKFRVARIDKWRDESCADAILLGTALDMLKVLKSTVEHLQVAIDNAWHDPKSEVNLQELLYLVQQTITKAERDE